MPPVFRYFWFICAAFMLANLGIWRRRLTTAVVAGAVTPGEAERFLRLVTIWLVGGPLAIGSISLLAGWSSPLCASTFAFGTPQQALTSGVVIAAWLALLWWIWRADGAEFLARVIPALSPRPTFDRRYSARGVRLAITGMMLVTGVLNTIASRTIPVPSQFACPASSP